MMMRSKSSSFSGELSPGAGVVLEPVLKLVFVGDPGVGKSTLLDSYRRGEEFSEERNKEPVPVLEGFTKSVEVGGRVHPCLLWDTLGSKDFDRLRPLSYPKTDCFVICFAMNDPVSSANVKSVWIPEVELHSPEVPYILVATKTDLKKTESTKIEEVGESGEKVEDEAAETTKPEDGGVDVGVVVSGEEEEVGGGGCDPHVQCSSKDLKSVENILICAVQAVVAHQEKVKALKDAASSQSFCRIC